jgi:hypothetical protein
VAGPPGLYRHSVSNCPGSLIPHADRTIAAGCEDDEHDSAGDPGFAVGCGRSTGATCAAMVEKFSLAEHNQARRCTATTVPSS